MTNIFKGLDQTLPIYQLTVSSDELIIRTLTSSILASRIEGVVKKKRNKNSPVRGGEQEVRKGTERG